MLADFFYFCLAHSILFLHFLLSSVSFLVFWYSPLFVSQPPLLNSMCEIFSHCACVFLSVRCLWIPTWFRKMSSLSLFQSKYFCNHFIIHEISHEMAKVRAKQASNQPFNQHNSVKSETLIHLATLWMRALCFGPLLIFVFQEFFQCIHSKW